MSIDKNEVKFLPSETCFEIRYNIIPGTSESVYDKGFYLSNVVLDRIGYNEIVS